MNTLSEANGNFAIHLLKMLCESNPSTNVCYSPMSISSALAMVLLGAKGDTAVQMSQVSCLSPLTCFTCLRAAEKGCQKFGKLADTILQCYLTEHVSLQTFKESCLQFYHSELEQLSFVKAAEESRKHINTWVSEQTEGKIPELLSGDSVNSETRLVLVNALYFKGKWHQPFHEDCTIEMPFKINQVRNSVQRSVQKMMCQEDTFNIAYVNEVQAQVLVIPYKGMELSLVVLLPDDGVDLSQVENNLTFEKLTSWTKPDFMRSTDVEVFLPKFKLQEDYDMESVFQRLGMVDVFQGGKADLSGMSLERDLCLSKFVHKSVVEVNEKGTEAAAATSAIVDYCCACEVSIFCADHPFLFFIRHNQTNTLLFCGRFSSP
uniref:Serpin domain-containing protein n=1 Tax=Peromyscus maniculatus bairdii TaxID=230844 RepID=A0A8C8U9A1_PERMB